MVSYFFGYYDKSPLNKSNTKLLAHRVSFDGRDVSDGDLAEVGYFDLSTKIFHKIDETLAWNWQQGSHLQWMPPVFEDEIIYNSIHDGHFVSVRYNTLTNKKRVIPFPIYVIHPNGKEALSVKYERHYWCRPGYNYQNIKDTKWNIPIHSEDGIFKVNLETGDTQLIIRTQDIVYLNPTDEISNSCNWLEHMMYSPDGERFLFFHRWRNNGADKSRFYTSSNSGSNLVFYPDTGFYSHCDWQDKEHLIVWTVEPIVIKNNYKNYIVKIKNSPLKRILSYFYQLIKPVIPIGIKRRISFESKLILFKDISLEYEVLGGNDLSGNGHTTVSEKDKLLLNDTYQDSENHRDLYFYDIEKKEKYNIGRFYSTYNSCGYRCDLHPRLARDKKHIVIDSAHCNKRKIMIIKKKS